jgi:hypothetical protein
MKDMAIKSVVASLVLGMVAFGSTAAQAGEVEVGFRVGGVQVHVHGDSCRHGPAPLPPPQARGRYEMQTVSRWVEGGYEQVWVPEVCETRHRRYKRVTRCTGGYYEQRQLAGHYEQVQEWVWVPYAQDDGWRSRRVHAASYYP